ncbi:hypothetical protein Trydic_g12205 [Trypoxylus dichotomus]
MPRYSSCQYSEVKQKDNTPYPVNSATAEVKEEKPGSARKTSRIQEDSQMSPLSSRNEDTGGRRTEEGSPAN